MDFFGLSFFFSCRYYLQYLSGFVHWIRTFEPLLWIFRLAQKIYFSHHLEVLLWFSMSYYVLPIFLDLAPWPILFPTQEEIIGKNMYSSLHCVKQRNTEGQWLKNKEQAWRANIVWKTMSQALFQRFHNNISLLPLFLGICIRLAVFYTNDTSSKIWWERSVLIYNCSLDNVIVAFPNDLCSTHLSCRNQSCHYCLNAQHTSV